jgi:uncharacterized protein YggE
MAHARQGPVRRTSQTHENAKHIADEALNKLVAALEKAGTSAKAVEAELKRR